MTITLSQATEAFLLTCKARNLSINTIIDYGHTLRIFCDHIGDLPVDQITIDQIETFLSTDRVKAKTRRNWHIGLSALYTWLEQRGYVSRNIMRLLRRVRCVEPIIHPFKHEEVIHLLAFAENDRDRAIVLTLLDSGMRVSELCALRVGDFDYCDGNSVLYIRNGKCNIARTAPISNLTAKMIKQQITDHDTKAQLFNGRDGYKVKRILTRSGVFQMLKRLSERAKIENVHPHRFRHTFATLYIRNGGDAITLRKIMGHTTERMSERYTLLAREDLQTVHGRASPVKHLFG